MDQDQEDKIKEVVEELEKAKEALFSLYGDESVRTKEIEHIEKAISKLESL